MAGKADAEQHSVGYAGGKGSIGGMVYGTTVGRVASIQSRVRAMCAGGAAWALSLITHLTLPTNREV